MKPLSLTPGDTATHTPLIEAELKQFFTEKGRRAAASGPLFEHMWHIASVRMLGGKFVRPRLFLESLEALRGERVTAADASALRLATALELLHFSFLLHDDVIDGDLTRRGEPNFIAQLAEISPDVDDPVPPREADVERRSHFARSCAILLGDLLLADVHQIFAGVHAPEHTRTRLLGVLERTVTDSVIGEQLDVALSDRIISPDLATTLQMCARKTATYTFELPLRVAAAHAGANPDLELLLAHVGQHLGLAFQLQDDLLSAFGDPSQHGKDPFSDLREGKETAVIAHARMTSAWPAIEESFGDPQLTHAEGARVRDLLVQCGAKEFTEALIDDQLRALHELLADHRGTIPAPLTVVVSRLSSRLQGRAA